MICRLGAMAVPWSLVTDDKALAHLLFGNVNSPINILNRRQRREPNSVWHQVGQEKVKKNEFREH